MTFPHELKEIFPKDIIEVRGNAEALTVILFKDTDVNKFAKILEGRFVNLDYTYDLFLRNEDSNDFVKITLK